MNPARTNHLFTGAALGPLGPLGRLDADWCRQAVVYQIYPRTFADSNGDGVGDLRGIISRVPYLAALGIDAVWLSPFCPSALADGGYDVDDYRDVDPALGTLADFDALTAALYARKIKIIIDIVPSLLIPGQPGLNWENRRVRSDFLKTTGFWSDRGVDGFRVDVVFNEHDPPYVSPAGPGQAFNFDLLAANWDAGEFLLTVIGQEVSGPGHADGVFVANGEAGLP
jgi:glycosidase